MRSPHHRSDGRANGRRPHVNPAYTATQRHRFGNSTLPCYAVYAQPLYVRGVRRGTVRNVLYVATMNDKVTAFNADSSAPTPFDERLYEPAVDHGLPATTSCVRAGTYWQLRIDGTPVIDRATASCIWSRTDQGKRASSAAAFACTSATGLSRRIPSESPRRCRSGRFDAGPIGRDHFNHKMHQRASRPSREQRGGALSWRHLGQGALSVWFMGFYATKGRWGGFFRLTHTGRG